MSEPLYPEVEVELSSEDGNVFAIIGHVSRVIRRKVGNDEAEAFSKEAFRAESYDEVIQLVLRTVNVS